MTTFKISTSNDASGEQHFDNLPHLSRASMTGRGSDLDTDFDSDIEKAEPSEKSDVLSKRSKIPASTMMTTIAERSTHEHRMQRQRTLERTYSVTGSLAPRRADPAHRLVPGFRTLSIHLSQGVQPDEHPKKGKALKDLSELDWHKISIDEALTRLGVSPTLGLDIEQAKRRLAQNGPNRMSKPPKRLFRKICGYVLGGFGSLLLGGSIVCFIAWKPLGNPNPQTSNLALAILLLVVVLFQAFFNAFQDWSTSRVMESVGSMLPSDVLVLRDGKRITIPATNVVTGDIVVISMGQKIAADMRIISLNGDLKFDRSVLTGESDAVSATVDCTDDNILESRNIAMAGTSCVEGLDGLGLVIAVADNTVFGRLAKMSSAPSTGRTTLQQEIFLFIVVISALAAAMATICVIIWAAYLRPKHPGFMSVSALLVNVVSIGISFIPEGLPIAVTLSLTVIANRMRKVKVLARSLSTCETLGSVSLICSDKTGTLTQGRMTAATVGVHGIAASPSDAAKHIVLDAPIGHAFKQLQFVAAVCNASSFAEETIGLPVSARTIHGDATDSAILRLAEELDGVDKARRGWEQQYQLSFNSKNKFMVRVVTNVDVACVDDSLSASEAKIYNPASDAILLTKGAPDVLIGRCTEILDAGGEVLPLTEERKAHIMAMQLSWANEGQRVLLLARRIISSHPTVLSSISDAEAIELNSKLTIVGLVGLIDPPRPETAETVRICRGAGARFFMVTGDFEGTAVAIARQCGIVTSEKVSSFADLSTSTLGIYDVYADNAARPQNALSLTGSDMMRLEVSDWEQVCRFDEIVFSRTTPEQKLRIVKEFQQRKHVVAMTGDGVNDAPSLKQADVGVAMGSGSAVAMEAADLILLENFSSIVDALLLGRLCFDNLCKSMLYLLPAGSFAELWAVLLSFFFGLPQALSNLQMIFVCVGTDLLPSLSLTQEKAEADLLTRKPRNTHKDHIVSFRLLFHAYVVVGLPITVSSAAMCFWYMQRQGIPFSDMWLKYGGGNTQATRPEFFNEVLNRGQSVYFFNLVLMQWFTLLAVRTRKLSIFQQKPLGDPRTSNWTLFPSMAFALLLAVFLSYVPSFQHVFLTRGVSVEHYFLPIAFGLVVLSFDELRKYCVRTFPSSIIAKMAW